MQTRTSGTAISRLRFATWAIALATVTGTGPVTAQSSTVGSSSCSAPSTCPTPDEGASPEVTCYSPASHTIEENPRLHIYGKNLVREDAGPVRLIYRNDRTSGTAGRTNEDIEVHSACHVSVELYVAAAPSLAAGSTVEFRLLRDAPSEEMIEENDYSEVATDWHTMEMTE